MYLIQEKPYLRLLIALIFCSLPLALLLHDAVALGLWRQPGLLLTFDHGGLGWRRGWGDPVVWFVCGVFGFLNLPLSAGLVKLAHKKMMRRHVRYALFLAGVAAMAAVCVGWEIGLVLGKAALGGLHEAGVVYYAVAVWLLAMLTLPKTLTRAPVQPVVFHKMKR